MENKSCENCGLFSVESGFICKHSSMCLLHFYSYWQPIIPTPTEMIEVETVCASYDLKLDCQGCEYYGRCKNGVYSKVKINPNQPALQDYFLKKNYEHEMNLMKSILANTPQIKANTDLLVLLNTGIAIRELKLKQQGE